MARALRAIAIAVLVVCALALTLLWRLDDPRIERLRMRLADAFLPSFDTISAPLAGAGRLIEDWQSYAAMRDENRELRRQIERMRSWRDAAQQLERENAELRALNNLRLSPRIGYVAGEVRADGGGPFGQSVLINIGAEDGVEDGAAVVDGHGMVGRVVGLGDEVARVLLLSDYSSRVPVKVLPSGRRGVLSGDGDGALRLDFLADSEGLFPGNQVVTSGDDGVFPPDLEIGVLTALDRRGARVRLAANFQRMEFLRALRWRPEEPADAPGALITPRLPRPGPDSQFRRGVAPVARP